MNILGRLILKKETSFSFCVIVFLSKIRRILIASYLMSEKSLSPQPPFKTIDKILILNGLYNYLLSELIFFRCIKNRQEWYQEYVRFFVTNDVEINMIPVVF